MVLKLSSNENHFFKLYYLLVAIFEFNITTYHHAFQFTTLCYTKQNERPTVYAARFFTIIKLKIIGNDVMFIIKNK